MAWGGSSDPTKFLEALAWFASRAVFTRDDWNTLATAAQQRAFTITGIAQLDILVEVHDSLTTAVSEGRDFAEWRRDMGDQIEAAWLGTVTRPGPRLETIYRNALQSSFNTGRYVQQTRPSVLVARPYWVFDAVLDQATSSICESRAGVTKPADDPWWDGNYPPMHHRCRSSVRTVRRSEGEQRVRDGLDQAGQAESVRGSWGGKPTPLEAWEPDPSDYPVGLWNAYMDARSPGELPERVADPLTQFISDTNT
jgi:SPP1 gp7 family putative phage head morphogenesis protein